MNIIQLKNLWRYLSPRRKKQFYLVLVLMFLVSITEVISVGAIIPFLAILTAPEVVYQHEFMQPINNILNITSSEQLLLPLTIAFILTVILVGIFRLLLLFVVTRLSFATGADLSNDIYRLTLYQDYSVHVSRNSSELINAIIVKTNTVIGGIIWPTLTLISSLIIILAILGTLFLIELEIALIVSLGFGLLYFGVIRYTKKQLRENSQIIAEQSTQMVKSLQEWGGYVTFLLMVVKNFIVIFIVMQTPLLEERQVIINLLAVVLDI